MKKNQHETLKVKELPCLALLVSHKNREKLLEYVDCLKKSVGTFEGELFDSQDYVDEIMLIFKFTDFDNYHDFADFAKARK